MHSLKLRGSLSPGERQALTERVAPLRHAAAARSKLASHAPVPATGRAAPPDGRATPPDGLVRGGLAAQERIVSCVRVRPLADAERAGGQRAILRVGEASVALDRRAFGADEAAYRQEALNTNWVFDRAFGPSATTAQLYAGVAASVVPAVLAGASSTILA